MIAQCTGWSLKVATVVATLALSLGGCAAAGESVMQPSAGEASSGPVAGEPSTAPTTASSAIPSEGGPGPSSPGVTVVTIDNLSFGAPEITVAVGIVTFVNGDDVPHTVTEGENGAAAPDGRFDAFVDVGESIEINFAEPGDYRITCQFHAEMHLLVHAQ